MRYAHKRLRRDRPTEPRRYCGKAVIIGNMRRHIGHMPACLKASFEPPVPYLSNSFRPPSTIPNSNMVSSRTQPDQYEGLPMEDLIESDMTETQDPNSMETQDPNSIQSEAGPEGIGGGFNDETDSDDQGFCGDQVPPEWSLPDVATDYTLPLTSMGEEELVSEEFPIIPTSMSFHRGSSLT